MMDEAKRGLRGPVSARSVKIACVSLVSMLLGACAGIGQSDFSCSGPNPGLGCLPSSEVYEITNDPELYKAVMEALNEAASKRGKVDHQAVIAEVRANFVRPSEAVLKPMADPIQTPMPVLQPARVIRIWISPWVDTKGDLRMPGYVFTEITPRRWSFGEPAIKGSDTLAPIQVHRDAVQR